MVLPSEEQEKVVEEEVEGGGDKLEEEHKEGWRTIRKGGGAGRGPSYGTDHGVADGT